MTERREDIALEAFGDETTSFKVPTHKESGVITVVTLDVDLLHLRPLSSEPATVLGLRTSLKWCSLAASGTNN